MCSIGTALSCVAFLSQEHTDVSWTVVSRFDAH